MILVLVLILTPLRCCLRFGAPATDFLFEAMVDRLWEVAQGRFGARSMRACLESSNITLSQQRRIATAIILNSIPLATNPNGALLLTWLLDTSSFPSRYSLLAPRFTPHLSHLCTHKLAFTALCIPDDRFTWFMALKENPRPSSRFRGEF